MTHAFVLRSPVAHAHIKRIDAAAARRMPGVLFGATAEDVRADGLGDVPCMRRNFSTTFPATWSSTGTMTWATPRQPTRHSQGLRALPCSNSLTTGSLSTRWSRAMPLPISTRQAAPKDMLRLITPNVGGGFGMKAFVYP